MSTNSRPTIWEHAQSKGVSRRDFLTACAWMTAMLGLPVSAVAQVTKALENKPRLPVLWFHFQECTCCSESFIRSSHPGVADIILDRISLDYTETLMAASGHQAEDALRDAMTKYKGEYLMLVEGSARKPSFVGAVARATAACKTPSRIRRRRRRFRNLFPACPSSMCLVARRSPK